MVDPNRKLLRQKSEFTTIDNISTISQVGPDDVEETPSSLKEGLLWFSLHEVYASALRESSQMLKRQFIYYYHDYGR